MAFSSKRDLSGEGLCACGCGQPTPVAKRTRTDLGHVAGKHLKWANPAHARWRPGSREPVYEDRGYKTPCLIWQKNKIRGYGQMHAGGGPALAHRRAYEAAHGSIPTGWHVDHLCFQTDCLNPDHLEAVTPQENVRRQRNTKLTFEDALMIRELASHRSESPFALARELSEELGLPRGPIREVLRGRAWKDAMPT